MDLNNQMVEIAWTRYSPKQAEEKKKIMPVYVAPFFQQEEN